MSWRTIKNAGYFLEKNNLTQEDGMNKAAIFLQQIVEEFARACVKFYGVVEELPFIYRERQIHSMLLPAIAKVAQAAFVEQPITRKIKRKSQYGWIDYWVYYEPFVFLIELKHGWHALNSQKIRGATYQCWKKAIEQTKAISKAEAKALCIDPDKVLKMAMLIVPCYQSSQSKDYLIPLDKAKITEVHEFLVNNLSPAPNWSCMWALHKKLQTVVEFEDNRNEIYPSVGIMVRAETL
jgi:hypothetical protein